MTQRKLAVATQRSAATLSQQLETMEQEDLVVRRPNAEDRRTVDVALTPQGEAAAQGALDERRRTADELFGGLPASDRAALARILGTLETCAARPHGRRPVLRGSACSRRPAGRGPARSARPRTAPPPQEAPPSQAPPALRALPATALAGAIGTAGDGRYGRRQRRGPPMRLIFSYIRRHALLYAVGIAFLTVEALADLLQPTLMSLYRQRRRAAEGPGADPRLWRHHARHRPARSRRGDRAQQPVMPCLSGHRRRAAQRHVPARCRTCRSRTSTASGPPQSSRGSPTT